MGRQAPEILGHLAHKPTVYGKTISPEEVASHVSLEKLLDPYIHKVLGNPEL